MGMVNCTECGKEIFEKAQSCPGCGAVVGKPESKKDYYVLGELINANKWKGTYVLEDLETKLRKYFVSGNAKFITYISHLLDTILVIKLN